MWTGHFPRIVSPHLKTLKEPSTNLPLPHLLKGSIYPCCTCVKYGMCYTVDMQEEQVSVRIYKADRIQAKIEAAQQEVDIADIIRGWRFAAKQ
jgi:hypothetical protein